MGQFLSTRVRAGLWGQTATQNHEGGYFTAGQLTGTVLTIAIGFGNPCAMSTTGKVLFKGLQLVEGVGSYIKYRENLANDQPVMAALNALGVLGSLTNVLRACFPSGTRLLIPEGSKAIEDFKPGDLILSRSEDDPNGPVEANVVN